LRIRGWANRGKQKTFYAILAWILRHAARDLGFEIVPDGFVRITDLVRAFFSYREENCYFHLVAV
jgi:RNA:NAD 2'-phosphotransferase (TPT1/KptA family)